MWPVYAAGVLALAALAVGLVLGVAGERRGAVVSAIAVGGFALVGVAMYGVTEARYQSCVDHNGMPENSKFVVVGRHPCQRRVFGDVRRPVVR